MPKEEVAKATSSFVNEEVLGWGATTSPGFRGP